MEAAQLQLLRSSPRQRHPGQPREEALPFSHEPTSGTGHMATQLTPSPTAACSSSAPCRSGGKAREDDKNVHALACSCSS